MDFPGGFMPYTQKIIVLILLCWVCFSLSFVSSEISENFYISEWKITKWNEEYSVIWEWGLITFVATNNSILTYNATNYAPSNFTHPSSGVLSIGNLTIATSNNKTAEVLLLSIWGWFPGLVTSSSDWNLQKQVAQAAADGLYTAGTLVITDISFLYQNTSRSAIQFHYTQDPSLGNQNTTVVYDKQSGVLLKGFTEIFFDHEYVLGLELINSDLIKLGSTPLFISWAIDLTLISVIILPIIIRKKSLKK